MNYRDRLWQFESGFDLTLTIFYMSVINSYISEESNSKISVGPPKESSVDKMGWLNETYLLGEVWSIFYRLSTPLGITHPTFPTHIGYFLFLFFTLIAGDGGRKHHHRLPQCSEVWVVLDGYVISVWSPKESTVDKISIKLHLTGKSRLIIPLKVKYVLINDILCFLLFEIRGK